MTRVRTLVVRLALFALVILAAGCAYWGRRPLDEPTPEPHHPVWIWSGGNVEKWHGVVVTHDSVTGIPYGTSLECCSCRRSIPRTEVDSMTLGYHTVAETVTDIVGF